MIRRSVIRQIQQPVFFAVGEVVTSITGISPITMQETKHWYYKEFSLYVFEGHRLSESTKNT